MSETLLSISFNELCLCEDIEDQLIVEIVEYGIVTPVNRNKEKISYDQWQFDTGGIYWIKKALRLHRDLEIDWVAVAMVVELMQQNEALQKEKELYQRQLRRFIKNEPTT